MNNKQKETIEAIRAAFPSTGSYEFPYGENAEARNEPWKVRFVFSDKLGGDGKFLALNVTGQPRDKNHLFVNGRRVSLKGAVSYVEGVRNFF